MDDKILYTKIFFEMLDITASIYQDAGHEKIATPFKQSLDDKLDKIISSKIEVMRLDVGRSKKVEASLFEFKSFLVDVAIPDRHISLSYRSHKDKVLRFDEATKKSIVEDFFNSSSTSESNGDQSKLEDIVALNRRMRSIVQFQILSIQEKIDQISEARPNHPDHVLFREEQISFLETLRDSLIAISSIRPAERIRPNAIGAVEAFVTWWNSNNQKVVGWSISLPAAAVGISILQMAGVPVSASIAMLTVLAGGSKIPEIIREIKEK